MFKCEVVSVKHDSELQESLVSFKLSLIGSSKKDNHKLTGTKGSKSFIIGQVDKSIKKGDLIRCDGLPYIAKPRRIVDHREVYDSNRKRVKTTYVYDVPSGYSSFKLDSGYWVLRKK